MKLCEKFESRKAVHDKIINDILKGKKESVNPTCKFLIAGDHSLDLYKKLENSHTILLNFDLVSKSIPEKKVNEEILKKARENEKNHPEILKFKDCCTEEQSYLFLMIFYHASLKNLDIVMPGMFYEEPFELVIALFNENKNYNHLEIYLLDTDEKYIDEMIKKK